MRTAIGLILLILGYLGLGFWTTGSFLNGVNFGKNAVEMEEFITQEAAGKVASIDGIETTVSGRDITVTGIAASREQRTAILDNLESSDAVRVVRDQIDLLETASPYMFRGTKKADAFSYNGNTPARDAFDGMLTGDDASLVVAQGLPDDNWVGFVGKGLTGLSGLVDGELTVTDRAMTLTGTASNLEKRTEIEEGIANLPEGYSAVLDIDVLPTTPYVFKGTKAQSGTTFAGYIPDEAARGSFEAMVGTDADLTPTFGMPNASWPTAVGVGAGALANLNTGTMSLNDKVLTITGEAPNPASKNAIMAQLKTLPMGYTADANITVAPEDVYAFNGTNMNGDFSYNGFIPDEAARGDFAGLIGDQAKDLTLAAGIPDANWTGVAGTSIKGLQLMNNGSLSIRNRDVRLSGTVDGPDEEARVRALFAGLPSGYKADLDITALDDGNPVSIDLAYSAADGGRVSGKAPSGVDVAGLVTTLGLPSLNGAIAKSGLVGADAVTGRFATIGNVLGQFESASATVTPISTIFTGVLKSGQACTSASTVSGLTKSLGIGADVTVTVSPDEPTEGATRVNSATSKTEKYTDCVWTEVVEAPKPEPVEEAPIVVEPAKPAGPEISLAACQARATDALAGAKINFVTAKADLDPTSVAVIDALAQVIRPCLNGGIQLEVGGHTDDRGSAEYNAQLSLERAAAVVSALVDRGADANAITAKGYGESSPIASNDTAEGLAANRRTTFIWSSN